MPDIVVSDLCDAWLPIIMNGVVFLVFMTVGGACLIGSVTAPGGPFAPLVTISALVAYVYLVFLTFFVVGRRNRAERRVFREQMAIFSKHRGQLVSEKLEETRSELTRIYFKNLGARRPVEFGTLELIFEFLRPTVSAPQLGTRWSDCLLKELRETQKTRKQAYTLARICFVCGGLEEALDLLTDLGPPRSPNHHDYRDKFSAILDRLNRLKAGIGEGIEAGVVEADLWMLRVVEEGGECFHEQLPGIRLAKLGFKPFLENPGPKILR